MDRNEVADREAIRVLLATYNINGDRGDVATLANTFAEDGVIEFGGEKTVGRAAIQARLGGGGSTRKPGFTVSRHHLSTSLVEIDGDRASGRTYFMVNTDIGPDHHGVYVDRFVRTGDGWRIAHRQVRIDWQAENSLFAPLHVRGKPPE